MLELAVLDILRQKNMTMRDLAKLMPDNWPKYRTIEAFISRGTGSISVAAAIANALNVTLNDLFIKSVDMRRTYISKILDSERDECLKILDDLSTENSNLKDISSRVATNIRNHIVESEEKTS